MRRYKIDIKFDAVMALGDTHGKNMMVAPMLLSKYGLDNPNTSKAIFHVGDFGIGFSSIIGDRTETENLNVRLKRYNVFMYVVRGNHDNPAYFRPNNEYSDSVQELSNIVFVEDHSVVELNGIKVYCRGGAISIDRLIRTEGRSYWTDEVFTRATMEEINEIPSDIDVIITHSRPDGVWPIDKSNIKDWLLEDMQLDYDIMKEAEDIKHLFDGIVSRSNKYIRHYYGHFHSSSIEHFDNITHQCLSINELIEIR